MSKSVVAAFSMSDLENLNGYSHLANFARKKGSKDKKKRMSKGGIAAGLAGAGALGAAGARYGGGAAAKVYGGLRKGGVGRKEAAKSARDVGAFVGKNRLNQDVSALKNMPRQVGKAGGRLLDSLKRAGGAAKSGLQTPTGAGGTNAGKLREPLNRLGNAAKGGLSTKGGKLGAGLLAAAAVGGAGAAALRSRKKRK